MPKASARPSLPTSSYDFALPPSSSVPSTSTLPPEDVNPLFFRFRRPSILAAPKATYLTDTRLHSPLVASFTHRRRGSTLTEESESDRERMWTDSSPSTSSGNPTPPLGLMDNGDDMERNVKGTPSARPLTPPRRQPFSSMDAQEPSSRPNHWQRRLSFPLKPPRIVNLLAESRPEENEVRSEAAFQRLVTSCSELPVQPRTPRNAPDRGRYPEEAAEEEKREDTSSDDGDGDDSMFAFLPSSEPISIGKPSTPANSVNGDDSNMWISDSPSAGNVAMDVDAYSGSPSIVPTSAPTQWRYTPPPTSSAVRSNKRKFDDRYDPYPTASKRRAVSPSISYLRETHPSLVSPILNARTVSGTTRLPMSVPISIPGSTVSSAASSPTIMGSYPISGISLSRPASITSSPILRAQIIGLASPILRPIPRRREEREIEGAGEAVGGLTLE